ncbi:hypothetical protein LINPERHAP1_LOCUS15667 [Linum perenne]
MLRLSFSWDKTNHNCQAQLDFNAGLPGPLTDLIIFKAVLSLSGLAALFVVRRSLSCALELTLLSAALNLIFLSDLLPFLHEKAKETKLCFNSTTENYKASLSMSNETWQSIAFLLFLSMETGMNAKMMYRESSWLALVYLVASISLAIVRLGHPASVVNSNDMSNVFGLHLSQMISDLLSSMPVVDRSDESLTNDDGYDGYGDAFDEAKQPEGSTADECSTVVDYGHEEIDGRDVKEGIECKKTTVEDEDGVCDGWQWEHIVVPEEEEYVIQ